MDKWGNPSNCISEVALKRIEARKGAGAEDNTAQCHSDAEVRFAVACSLGSPNNEGLGETVYT